MSDEVSDSEVVDGELIDGPVVESDGVIREVNHLDPSDEDVMVEVIELAQRLEAEKDQYLDLARRVQADFENYRKRVAAERTDIVEQAAVRLVGELLPVLDACEAALAHGVDGVGPIHAQLSQTLTKQGLALVAEVGVPFDPNVHEAVLSEAGEPGEEPTVAEVLRAGYVWNGRVVRAAMVKVRG